MHVFRVPNPFAFTVSAVTVIITTVYIGLFVGLLYVHHVVPSAPQTPTPFRGVNLTEAWLDLQELSNGYHPYNSHRNDDIREWLLRRVDDILKRNGIHYETHTALPSGRPSMNHSLPLVIVYNDLVSNATYSAASPISVYFEGTNLMIYVRGSDDDDESYHKCLNERTCEKRAVLVNAHYDSVSTGFGATDDGVGVISILQLLSYFTTPGQQPSKSILALLNNGEEDYLNGAWAFAQHPASRLPDAFLNLEGAGAGGRAMLFRSTDAEVTMSYSASPHPFGTVLSADAFKKGIIRSQTDYSVFNSNLSLRGLDVAFFEPRASYHTSRDSIKHTGRDSLWHMLSAALQTTRELTSDTSASFEAGDGSKAVWFDVFGYGFGVITQDALFAICVILLVLGPLMLTAILYILTKHDKMYLFARKVTSDPLDARAPDEQIVIALQGWRGFSRFPIAFILATVACILLALLVAYVNPYIVYSSQYSVWTMMISVWLVVAWFILRGADYLRASALHRAHAIGWIYAISWILLALTTYALRVLRIAGLYGFMFLNAGLLVALLISHLDQLALPSKSAYAMEKAHLENTAGRRSLSQDLDRPTSKQRRFIDDNESSSRPGSSAQLLEEEHATETTSLLGQSSQPRRNSLSPPNKTLAYGDEQSWSADMPTWTWLAQFLALGPVVIIFFGQIALLITSATHQTPADGNPVLPIYGALAVLTTILLMPASPSLHRLHFSVPGFLLLSCAATIVYNATAFPFSEKNRLKVYFSQELDLDTGRNHVNLTTVKSWGPKIILEVPSAQGQHIYCSTNKHGPRGPGLETCQWSSIMPEVVEDRHQGYNDSNHKSWLKLDARRVNNTSQNEAMFALSGRNTRSCKLKFETPVLNYTVTDASPEDERFVKIPEGGIKELRLWSRTWDKTWNVRVTYATSDKRHSTSSLQKRAPEKRFEGRAVCLWNDDNRTGAIPALDELRRFMPSWSIVTKAGDGLVEASTKFSI